jgi:acyl-CoA thioesterase-1
MTRRAAPRRTARGWAAVAVLAAAILALGLVAALTLRGTDGLAAPAPTPAAARVAAGQRHLPGPSPAGQRAAFAACERRLERTQPPGVPRLAVIGASFTAGVGSSPGQSWAAQLTRRLHWNAATYGVPGAGYVRPGTQHGGPVAAEVTHVGLPSLDPSLIIVQAGHDDIGIPASTEEQRVTQAIDLIRAQAPHAHLVLLTVFPGHAQQAAARTDQAIVTAARAADPAVIIADPLTGRWIFPHSPDGLHPTAAGSAWIASHVAVILHAGGIHPAPPASPVICSYP